MEDKTAFHHRRKSSQLQKLLSLRTLIHRHSAFKAPSIWSSLPFPPTVGCIPPTRTPRKGPPREPGAMKRRITLIHRPDDAVDPSSARIHDGVISGPELRATREERLTFSSDELPEDVLALLSRCASQLHARWATSSSYEAPELLSSRVSPGLHIFHQPPDRSMDES